MWSSQVPRPLDHHNVKQSGSRPLDHYVKQSGSQTTGPLYVCKEVRSRVPRPQDYCKHPTAYLLGYEEFQQFRKLFEKSWITIRYAFILFVHYTMEPPLSGHVNIQISKIVGLIRPGCPLMWWPLFIHYVSISYLDIVKSCGQRCPDNGGSTAILFQVFTQTLLFIHFLFSF